MASQPTVISAHFKFTQQAPRVLKRWRSGYTGPVKVAQNTNLPLQVEQTGFCTMANVTGVLENRGDPAQTVASFDAQHLGTLGACWKVDAYAEGVPNNNQTDNTTKLCTYWIVWEQNAYAAPTVT